MENAEEVMQLLEEFSKVKPKEIPRELEDYLGYVAKTGDPVFQWSLTKCLLREKLLNVITDFYESTLTVELPPCPNVEPFNYERMKTSLLERFDMFSGAPFTIQRICELLINPRKEYNRADKYMRAIEKNILVVSTREPGTGKRPLECDQSETVLNGIPDVKLNESDGSLLHVPTDLPYLGAPPASNDVTIETTESNLSVTDRVGLGINGQVNSLKTDSDKSWPTEESHNLPVTEDSEQTSSTIGLELKSEDVPVNVEEKCSEQNDCDTSDRLTNIENTHSSSNTEGDENISGSEMIAQNDDAILPDSIDSSISIQEHSELLSCSKLENDKTGSVGDENEVSSSPADAPEDVTTIQEEVNEPADSEAEATDSCLVQEVESEINSSPESNSNSGDKVIQEDEAKIITISEVSESKSDEVDLECNEVSGTVISPISPESGQSQQSNDVVERKVNIELVEECEPTDSHPDSSNESSLINNAQTSGESETCKIAQVSEADSLSETNLDMTESSKPSENVDLDEAPDQTEDLIALEVLEEPSPGLNKFTKEECIEGTITNTVISSGSPEETIVSESSCSTSFKEDGETVKEPDVQSTSEVVEEMYDSERRDESVIQTIPHIAPDSQEQIAIEEISVDPSCEAEEEAMDIDDCSNQMMISEGENEGEPMDECDQL